ncbi:MAG: hypothetical protein M1834_001145 [Cirrosporium novae-zelandiae]|nr:MAG: hypothetical protein M1834_001145 [Cirrosporium novae-zelandiae]
MDLSHSEAGLLSGKSKRTHDRSRKKGHSSSRRNAAEGDERYPPKDEPDVEHLRQARANYFSKSPAERQARAKVPNISGPYEKMNHPKSSHRGTKDPETGHHKHRSKRSHTAREERAFKKNDEGEYVYRNNERKEENDQKSAKTTTQEGQESNKNELRRRKTVKPRTTSKGNPTSTNTDGKESKHGKSKAEDGHKARRSRADGANPGKPTITRSKTMYESPSKRHPSLERAKATRHASANPTIPPQVQSSSTKVEPGKKNDRNTGFLSMLFKAPPPAPPEKKFVYHAYF